MMLRVAAYTSGLDVPSARFRVRQYVSQLADHGVELTEFVSQCGKYPPPQIWRRPVWGLRRILEAMIQAWPSRRYDLVFFQRELLSTFLTVEPLYGRPRMLDVDDAIWLHRRGSFALRLARLCDAVVCGNTYLATYFSEAGLKTYILPTGVDTQRFFPKVTGTADKAIIGWSGSSGNLCFLESLDGALAVVLKQHPHARLRVICDQVPRFVHVPVEAIEYIPWTPFVEVSALQDLTVGLMPLADTEWARGKCAFKMLTYMACGIPVVVSPVGMNEEVLAQADVGLAARNDHEWVDAIDFLLAQRERANNMGINGRRLVESQYSTSVLSPRLARILREIAGL